MGEMGENDKEEEGKEDRRRASYNHKMLKN